MDSAFLNTQTQPHTRTDMELWRGECVVVRTHNPPQRKEGNENNDRNERNERRKRELGALGGEEGHGCVYVIEFNDGNDNRMNDVFLAQLDKGM